MKKYYKIFDSIQIPIIIKPIFLLNDLSKPFKIHINASDLTAKMRSMKKYKLFYFKIENLIKRSSNICLEKFIDIYFPLFKIMMTLLV